MEIYLILLFMIAASIVAVRMNDLISSVIALSTVGLGLCLGFLVLKAPNLAITQLVVEILCVIVLIRGTINRDLPLVRDGRWLFNTIATLTFIGFFLTTVFFALKELPRFGEPVMRISPGFITQGIQKHTASIVTAITTNFRSLDVLGEAAILFTAIIGALAITRKAGKVEEPKK
ncbi:MAG: hydrogenase subunit MbhD domain-containing protein [Candidatus Omnitrophota bacterium]